MNLTCYVFRSNRCVSMPLVSKKDTGSDLVKHMVTLVTPFQLVCRSDAKGVRYLLP